MAPAKKAKSNANAQPAPSQSPNEKSASIPDSPAAAAPPPLAPAQPTQAPRTMATKAVKVKAEKKKSVGRKKMSAAMKKRGTEKKRRFGQKPRRNFKVYVYKVLKIVHDDLGISKRAVEVMDSFCNDLFMRLAAESSHLCQINNKKPTLNAKEVESATKLVLPGELREHALNVGRKAIQKWQDC